MIGFLALTHGVAGLTLTALPLPLAAAGGLVLGFSFLRLTAMAGWLESGQTLKDLIVESDGKVTLRYLSGERFDGRVAFDSVVHPLAVVLWLEGESRERRSTVVLRDQLPHQVFRRLRICLKRVCRDGTDHGS